MSPTMMLRLVLILVLQCLLANGQGPGPGPGRFSSFVVRDTEHSRAVDTRLNFTVLEGQPTGTFIGRIPIKPGFTYRFNEAPKEFVLNGSTGEVHTAKELDREALATDKFDLVILSSQPTYPIEVRIVVLDINDNAPKFPEPSIHVTFSENANAGTRVILDTATDGDARENDITTNYHIVDGNEDRKFKLEIITNPSGETPYLHLETIDKLDRETKDFYQLNISAQDGASPPLYGFLLVNVSILDVNDNSPTFDFGDYNVTLSESVPPGTSILQVRASDADIKENARITYYLAETETQISIDPVSGIVSTVDRLKCERNCPDASQCAKSCVFTVNARDQGSPHQDGRTYVTVNLQDANDHNPVISFTYFPASSEFATVDENAKNASTVAVVSVIDADEGLNGETKVEILGGNELNHFRIDSKPNYDLVQVNGILDREKISKYNVTIVATDMGSPPRSSTSFLIILVNDINDHAPVFEKSEYSAVLSELVPVGTYVAGITANDEDTGVNSNVYYVITSGNDNRWFDIDFQSGLITTKAPLNREEQDSIDLKISARDGGPNPKRAYTHLKISILDENDEKPTFSDEIINVNLSENAPPNSLVALVTAIDRDQGTNGSVSYTFHEDVEQNYPGIFSLDSSTGRIKTKSKLDRETIPQYDITIEARDRGIPPLSSTATVRLTVLDVNDNSPEFYPQKYFVSVPEDYPIGSSILELTATDKDEGENAEVSFELLNTPENDNTFELNSKTGIISLSGRLSLTRKSKYTLKASVKDSGNRKAVEDALIEIVIENGRSEFLKFESEIYSFKITEDPGLSENFKQREIGAIKVEQQTNQEDVTYTIIAGDPDHIFSIDEKTGMIVTAKRVDAEKKSFYSLTAVASTSYIYGETFINITVHDINDNPPKFPMARAHASVEENWPVGHQVFLASAHDSDIGKNSDITYSLSVNPGNHFSISKKSGMIYLNKPVKYGVTNGFRLEVTAADNGVPSLSSKQTVVVSIKDVNDHTPIFEHSSYETSLLESIPVNERFFALTASDEDQGINGFISYNITDGNDFDKFGIFPDGYLYVKSSLDREKRDYFALKIVAKDHGVPSRSSTVLIVIHILDENDNSPAFTNKTFDFYLAENEPPDTYVGRLTASDDDKGRNAELTYSIVNNQHHFLIDPKSGFIKTMNYFDREKLVQVTGQDYVTMEAVVIDNGIIRLKDKAKVNIYITDVNDNAPMFTRRSYKTDFSEGATVGTPILRLSAKDADEGANGDIVYSLTDGNEEQRFRIDEISGQVSLARKLDRETTPVYSLIVTASDRGSPEILTASTSLEINILDENDNYPVFTQSESEISILETTEVNTVLVQFKATDADLGVNQEVSFMIGGGNMHESFRIDTRTGTLYLEKSLDFEKQSLYNLNITAADGGLPRLTSTIAFEVRVLDYNDNAPYFPNTTIVRQIQEGIPYKSKIVTITAHDPDSSRNGKISYAIKNQDPPGKHFEIERDTGVIYTVLDIDREFNDTFMITVVATDQAEPPANRLSAEKLVTVIVEDVNDNAPMFISMNAGLLYENSRKNQEIMKVHAKDVDANTNGLVTYEIVSGATDVFSLDRMSGSLKLRHSISSPKLMYSLTVRATDEAVQSQRKSSDAYLTILGLSSQEGPIFSQRLYRVSVTENSGIGTSVATVEARAPPSVTSEINYFVVNVTGENGLPVGRVFDVQRRGILATSGALDRESGPSVYIVTVAAALTQSPTPRISLVEINVSILDQNDSPPCFKTMPSKYSVSEDHQAGRRIATISATDPDTIGSLSYSLISGDDGKFNLDSKTGHLSLRDTLDRETKDSYDVVVRADDGVQHTDTTIRIEVSDTNDNPPVFHEPAYSFDIPENAKGTQVGRVSAWDADEDTNGRISYTVISDWGNDVFSLNPQTGIFTLTSLLDYEQVQHYILVVQAQDTGRPSLSSTVTVYFNVQDLNDNAPLFDPISYSEEIYENITVGSPVLTVTASDQDSGLNGELDYSIVAGNDDEEFSINANGTIYTTALLDREEQSFYNLVVRASDRAVSPETRLSSTVQVTIILRDVNDMSPDFVTPNELEVAENTPVNTVIMAVKAVDKDEGRNSYIEYSLSPIRDDKFTLGPVDGLLQIAGPLDRESIANYTLIVTARDRGSPPNSNTLSIHLKIADENDNSPVFDPKQYSASVPENASIGLSVLQVSATDADEDMNGRVRYSIVAGDKNRDFFIGEDTGVIRVAKNLNYERRNHYLLTVQAEDSGNDVRYDSSTVTISIMDINDNAPVFLDSPFLVYVMENMDGLPTSIATVSAFDADNPPYNRVNYLVKDGDKSMFAVNASSGEISLLRALDREEQQHYSLTVVAIDSGTPRLTGTGTISVLVRDENDHSPEFQKPEYNAIISESIPSNTPIIALTASDKDYGLNAKIKYSLAAESSNSEVFSVDPETGVVKTLGPLDRERVTEYTILVEAKDSSLTDPRSATTQLTVTLMDENDNAPMFAQESFVIYIPDPTPTGSFVFGHAAEDPDEGMNGRITYYLSGSDADKFSMKQETGVIKASTHLTGRDYYDLEIHSSDSGSPPLTSEARLKVYMRPARMFPEFKSKEKSFSFSESEREKVITTLSAFSPKLGMAGKIHYEIAGGNIGQAFDVDEDLGEIRISRKGLDYETLPQYELWISARDSDNPPLAASTHLIVNVSDFNDNTPIFEYAVYNTSIIEDLYPPKLVARIRATDKDSNENSQITYHLGRHSSASNTFKLNPDTGEIFTKMKLDRESIGLYSFTVEAVDNGSPPKTGTAMVQVTVQDKNDNPPRFTRLFSVNVTENAQVGTFVIQVTSSDRDIGENANATYSFTVNPNNKFHIDPVSGNVTVASAIDREIKDEYLLKVSAFDGSWRAETPLTIIVQDENDNAPVFEQSQYEFNFPELQRSVAFVGQVSANDIDKPGPNSAISYSFKFPSDFFTIDPTSGEILSKQALKYKHTLRGISPENQYPLSVIATDNGKPPMSSETAILINVVDANNNAPKFVKENNYYFSPVLEMAEIGQPILQVSAVDDLDFGINAEIHYEKVTGNGTNFFNLDTKTGWISVSKSLMNRSGTRYMLLVKAEDRGVPPKKDDVRVFLEVTGDNRFKPKFTATSYQVMVPENEKVGSSVINVVATDGDKGYNGKVKYSIVDGNEADMFDIDQDRGSVTVKQPLDFDTEKIYILNVTAKDLAFYSKYATATLTIKISDVNDNPPVFDYNKYDVEIPENSQIGTFVHQLQATDIDEGQNAVIYYKLVGGDGKNVFSIDKKTGSIVSKKVFDYEEKNLYIVEVLASNPESIQMSTTKVYVHITSRNEFFPKFVQPVFQFTISESATIGSSVGIIQATDDDEGVDGLVYYLLVGSSNDKGFIIQPTTGELIVSRNLDRESQSRVVLTVMAKNAGSIRGNDTDEAQIIVSIQDGNDPPVFDQPYYETKLSEGAQIGTTVLTVKAEDKDVRTQNNQFTYSIIGGNPGHIFKVDPKSGVIETTSHLDREDVPVFNLTIGAIDNGTPTQTGTTLVRVILKDINDNGPQFDPPEVVGYVSENEPAMTSVMTLSATDPDLPPNTQPFTYKIVGGEHRDFFSVEPSTGVVKTTRTVDRETTPVLTFSIEVEDSGKPKMKSEHDVTINVLDKNDSPSTSRKVDVAVLTFKGVFPGGNIADVHPNDPDSDGKYRCQILKDESSIFSIPNACNLHVARMTPDKSYSLSVTGNDGKHKDVTSHVKINFKQFDNQTLANSITLRFVNVSSERFLLLYYQPFMETLQNVFIGKKVEIISMADVQSHTDVILGVKSSDVDYLTTEEVSMQLTEKSSKVSRSLQGLHMIINYNPCADSPCENDSECSHAIRAYDETETVDSPSFVFTSLLVRHEALCQCRQGFTGRYCQLRQDPCAPNPCQAGGTCAKKGLNFACTCPPNRQGAQCEFDRTNACDNDPCRNGGSCQTTLEGGFFCLCRPGYRGMRCELVTESCKPNPCMNGGSCISLKPDYRCACPVNFFGQHCERSTYSFKELSYMTFPTLDATTNDISLTFSTNKQDSLLVYNYGVQTGGRSDFVAIELTGGRPRFSFGGSRTAITSISVNKKVTDGNWHRVTATRNGRVVSLSVATCYKIELCNECRPGDSSCYADDTGHTGTLNFNNEPLYVGGVMTVDPIQERPGQILADDFVGCMHSISINGRALNLSAPIQSRSISDVCGRKPNVCAGNPCGEGGTCLDRWLKHMCLCPNGLLAPDCGNALNPVSLNGNSFVEFMITEQHRRHQLLPKLYSRHVDWSQDNVVHNRISRHVSQAPPKSLSLSLRTVSENGVLLYAATNNDYTVVNIRDSHLEYISKLGANPPVNMTIPDIKVNDGLSHNLTLLSSEGFLSIIIDDTVVGEQLESSVIHDFLDAYLTSILLGSVPREKFSKEELPGFTGCIATLAINGEVQPFNSTGTYLQGRTKDAVIVPECVGALLGPLTATTPLSIGITVVIVFFAILLFVIMASFVGVRLRKRRKEKNMGHLKQNGSALLANTSTDSGRSPQDSGFADGAEMTDDVLRTHLSQETKKYKEREHDRPHQRPDIIEREIMNKSPGVPLRVDESSIPERDPMGGHGHIPDNLPEHYDLENASSIAPSDIDIVYHYKEYRDGNIRKYKTNPHVQGYHKHGHRHSPHNFPNTPHRESPRNILRQSPNPVAPRESPSVLKMQSTPLARLSPSSELSQQTPRILTLKDLSGKPLQTALLATSQGPGVKDVLSNSERSLNSPISHMSQSSGSMHASSQSTKKKKHEGSVNMGLTPDDIDRLNHRPRNSSLVSTLDAVSSSSEDNQRKHKIAELLETNTELLEAPDSSTDESGNDSFTCSEFEYENNYEKVTRDFGPGNMIFSKLAEVENENEHDNESSKNFDGFDSFRGSLSTLVASDDDLSNMSSYKPPNGTTFSWDYLLNWGPNFENLVGVFKDIAELPDNTANGRVSARGTPKPAEEYV